MQHPSLADEISLYTTIADYEARPSFVGPLRISPGELDRIVGKYELGDPEVNWAACGLNGCNTRHKFGYIIRTKGGKETNCGQDCGKREFGVEFEEVEARLKAAEDAAARIRAVEALLANKPAYIKTARELLPQLQDSVVRYSRFVSDFQHQNSFTRTLDQWARQGGVVKANIKGVDGKEVRQTVGVIAGIQVRHKHYLGTRVALQEKVIDWLDGLSEESVQAMSKHAFEAVPRQGGAIPEILESAKQYIGDVDAFLAPANFELYSRMALNNEFRTNEGWGRLIRHYTGT